MESFYEPRKSFDEYVNHLEKDKVAGDELSVVLLSKYLKRNITVLGPSRTWKMYPVMKDDIVISFDGRYYATQDTKSSIATSRELDYIYISY